MKTDPYSSFARGGHKGVVVFCDDPCGGAYVLRLRVQRNLRVRFGQFMGGRRVFVEKGTYVYVGSAMGHWETLGRRLARHASRSGSGKPHAIRGQVVDVFGAEVLPRGEKRLRWHVDFLLDRSEVDVTHMCVLCSHERLEGAIASALRGDDETQVLAPGLGASDAPGQTHLVRVPDSVDWWQVRVMHFCKTLGTPR